ncbi:hormonally up-regulated neu tumor-associated kinase-like [Elysia marginata]|uniref:Hormonally up-regulated neu tumor-associated kinase-like n=1 Tax=Elysia marginata TaxID=1093978 RepID=A0AAV4JCU7_9GAST|nr:hormonally up-regulated neu tumor-associated kinase-like [Elysia marginata]
MQHEVNCNDICVIKAQTDFGLSNFVKVTDRSDGTREGELCSTQCGSPAYAAPELLNHEQYGLQVDSWSIGVNMFAMLTGGLPFTVEPFNIKALYVKMRDGHMNPVPEGLTKECRDLLRKFLTPDPTKRVTIEQALVHPWLTHGSSQPVQRVSCPNKLKTNDLNTDILSHMSDNLGFRMGEVIKFVTCNTPSAACATYHLYLTRLKHYQEQQEQSSKKTNSTRRRSGILDKKFSKNSLNNVNNIKNNNTTDSNRNHYDEDHEIIENYSNHVSADNHHQHHQDQPPSPITSPSPQPKYRDCSTSPPSRKAHTTPTTSGADQNEAPSRDSPRSALSDTSDHKENNFPQVRENSIKFDESQHINGLHSPRPTYHVNRAVSIRTQQEDKQPNTQASSCMSHRPRLYKRRGESTLSSTNREKLPGDVHETIEVLDISKPSRDITGISTVYRSDGNHDLGFSRMASPGNTTRPAPGDQPKRGRDGLAHIGVGDGSSGGAVYNGNPTNRGLLGASIGGVSTTDRARHASKSPVSFLQRFPDPRHQSLPLKDTDRKDNREDSFLGPGDANTKQTPRTYLQNKKTSMLAKRAAALKELKPAAPNRTADTEKVHGRLQEANIHGRAPNNSNLGGRTNHQVGKVIPRPFVPFRSAHERPNGFSSSYSHQMGPPQKAKTAETLTLRHDNSTTVHSSRASGPPAIPSRETQAPGPPRPVIVRKRLVKRHRLGELNSLQPSLIHDIEQTVTASSYSSADAISTTNSHSRKTPHVKESLS